MAVNFLTHAGTITWHLNLIEKVKNPPLVSIYVLLSQSTLTHTPFSSTLAIEPHTNLELSIALFISTNV